MYHIVLCLRQFSLYFCLMPHWINFGLSIGSSFLSMYAWLRIPIFGYAFIFADEDAMSSDDELNWGERELQDAQMRLEDKGLKDMLLSRFGSHIGTLKLEFSKKKKKGKLPKEGRKVLFEWWNVHYKWPYPTVYFLSPPANIRRDVFSPQTTISFTILAPV